MTQEKGVSNNAMKGKVDTKKDATVTRWFEMN